MLICLILIGITAIGVLLLKTSSGITGEVIFDDSPHYTKAICDQSKFCQDYKIYCEDGELVRMVAIEGAMLQHFDDWVDPRGEDADVLCK